MPVAPELGIPGFRPRRDAAESKLGVARDSAGNEPGHQGLGEGGRQARRLVTFARRGWAKLRLGPRSRALVRLFEWPRSSYGDWALSFVERRARVQSTTFARSAMRAARAASHVLGYMLVAHCGPEAVQSRWCPRARASAVSCAYSASAPPELLLVADQDLSARGTVGQRSRPCRKASRPGFEAACGDESRMLAI